MNLDLQYLQLRRLNAGVAMQAQRDIFIGIKIDFSFIGIPNLHNSKYLKSLCSIANYTCTCTSSQSK